MYAECVGGDSSMTFIRRKAGKDGRYVTRHVLCEVKWTFDGASPSRKSAVAQVYRLTYATPNRGH